MTGTGMAALPIRLFGFLVIFPINGNFYRLLFIYIPVFLVSSVTYCMYRSFTSHSWCPLYVYFIVQLHWNILSSILFTVIHSFFSFYFYFLGRHVCTHQFIYFFYTHIYFMLHSGHVLICECRYRCVLYCVSVGMCGF